jgi:hypothetical protein
MKKTVLLLALLLIPTIASAGSLTFDLRDPSIEAIDEVNSFSLNLDGLTATLWALPTMYGTNNVVLNQTSSSFGVNVNGTTCGGTEDSATIDGGCISEAIKIVFDSDVFVNSLRVSNFGYTDAGLATLAAVTYYISSTGTQLLGDTFLAAGSALTVAYTGGNGFSLDSFTVTKSTPEPATILLLVVGVILMFTVGRRRHLSKA